MRHISRTLLVMLFSRRLFSAFAALFFLLPSSFCYSQAQQLTKQQITASYLYNFAKNIEWPEGQSSGDFKIGFYDTDDGL